jgi:Holliday junction resolvase RusA-like endonuclease
VLPFEFIVPGRPVSNQTKDKSRLKAWRQKVSQVAAQMWGSDLPTLSLVHIQLTHYFDVPNGKEDTVPDSDNIVKPIREALRGVVYEHDYQVTDVVSRRRNLNSSFKVT